MSEAKPKRIQRKRTKGWKMPPNTVYVGRPSKWGNPYRVDFYNYANFADVVTAYRGWIVANQQSSERFRLPVAELRGKDLACWCPLDRPCHADVLLELANNLTAGAEEKRRPLGARERRGETMKWICKLGIHSWEFIGWANLMLSDSLKRCKRCGCGRIDIAFGQAYCKYTPEQMRELVEHIGA